MRYFVVAEDGAKYGPADVQTLNSWISEGRLVGSSLLEEEGSGARIAASAVPGLNFPGPAVNPGPSAGPSFAQNPGPAQNPYASAPGQNPYSAPYATSNAYSTGEEGKTEMIISWVCGVLGLCCCGLLPIVGIIMAVVAKNKGNRNAQPPLIFNIIALVLSVVLTAIMLPNFMKGFSQGYNQSMQRQRVQSIAPSP